MNRENSTGARSGEGEAGPHDPTDEDAPTPAPENELVEGRAFEEFCSEVDRAFPEDELSMAELVALPAGDGESSSDGSTESQASREDQPSGEAKSLEEPGTRDEGSSAGSSEERSADPSSDAVDAVGRFVDVIASRELTDDERERVRRALGVDAPTSTEVRLRHLQSNLADLEAYVDAIEAFIDGRGTARELLSELEDRVAALDTALSNHEEAVSELRSSVVDHRQRIETTDSRVGNVEDRLDEVAADLARIEDRLDELVSLKHRVARIEARQRRVAEAFTEPEYGGETRDRADVPASGSD